MSKTGFAAGTPHLTLADLCFVATFAIIRAIGHVDLSGCSALEEWFAKVKREIPKFEELIEPGTAMFASMARKGLGLEDGAAPPPPRKVSEPTPAPRSPTAVASPSVVNGSSDSETILVYGQHESAPCRVVYMVCEVVGAPYERVMCDIMSGQHMTPEYLKVN